MHQPGRVVNPARGQLNREKLIFPCPCTRLRVCSRETGSAAPSRVRLLIRHTKAELRAYSRDYSRFPRRRPFFFNRHTPSGQPRVHWVTQMRTDGAHCRESAGKGPVVLKVVPVTGVAILQVTMDRLMCASLFPHPLLVLSGHIDRM